MQSIGWPYVIHSLRSTVTGARRQDESPAIASGKDAISNLAMLHPDCHRTACPQTNSGETGFSKGALKALSPVLTKSHRAMVGLWPWPCVRVARDPLCFDRALYHGHRFGAGVIKCTVR